MRVFTDLVADLRTGRETWRVIVLFVAVALLITLIVVQAIF
jgi:hypothetical protein